MVPAAMEELGVPGVALGVLHESRVYTAGFGVTSLDNPLPVDEHTVFQIGSISKTFTATAVMRLVEMGNVELAAPIRTYLPDFALTDEAISRQVTLAHVLTHMGGWVGDYFKDFGRGADALTTMVGKLKKAPQQNPVGALWSYNNTGFNVAGRVIEAVTEEPFELAVKRLVFDPLGLEDTFYFPEEALTRRHAVGHVLTAEGLKVTRPWAMPRSMAPAGGVISCVVDQLRFAAFHLGDGRGPTGEQVLKPDSLDVMQSRQVDAGSLCEWMGLTWFLDEFRGAPTLGHGGSTNGFQTGLVMFPEQNFAVSILANSDHGHELEQFVNRWAASEFLGIDEPKRTLMELSTEELTEYTGRYGAVLENLELFVEDGALRVRAHLPQNPLGSTLVPTQFPPVRLAFYDTDRVVGLDRLAG